jgi:O-antigen/teichoic acid export membrane protein
MAIFLKKMLEKPEARKIFHGASYLISEKVFRIIIGIFIHAVIARYLTPQYFGKLGFIVNFGMAFLPLTLFGLDEIGVKKILEKNASVADIVPEIIFIRFIAFIFVALSSTLFLILLKPNDDWSFIYLTLGFSVSYNLINCLNTFELPYLGAVNNRSIFIGRFSGYLSGTLLKIIGVIFNFNLIYFILTYFIDELIWKLIIIKTYFRDFEFNFKLPTLNRIKPYLGTSSWIVIGYFFVIIEIKLGFVTFEEFTSDKALSFFTAASSLIDVWTFLPLAILSAFLPSLLDKKLNHPLGFKQQIKDLHSLFFVIELGFIIGVWFVAPYLVKILYGEAYDGADLFIRWQSLTVIITFTQLIRMRWALIEEKIKVWTLMSGTQLLLTFFLVYILGYGKTIEGLVSSSLLSFTLISATYAIADSFAKEAFLSFLKAPFHIINSLTKTTSP